jgi:hypothetical protein
MSYREALTFLLVLKFFLICPEEKWGWVDPPFPHVVMPLLACEVDYIV